MIEVETIENDRYYIELYPVSTDRLVFVLFKKETNGHLTFITESTAQIGAALEDMVSKANGIMLEKLIE